MFMAMLILAADARPDEPQVQARATIRILTAATASEAQWKLAKRRRERLTRDEQGSEVRLRTIEFE